MREATPQAIFLKDYTPPDYLIDTVDLEFELDEASTRVTARLAVRRNPASDASRSPLELAGEQLVLESLRIGGRPLEPAEYAVGGETLVLPRVPDEPFVLEVVTRLNPGANTSLEGLYASNGMLCTQCEAQGFRRITYFLDRPDVMSRYTARLVGDGDRYPVLLCNGNRIDNGELPDGRHWVCWEDPFRKPSYLFALVAGRLECIEDRFVTMSGREVTLQIFVEAHDRDKCAHAMESLKLAMRWDEQRFGREYDLDLYMIVAVGHFNMGAMENKGLNIFNTKYVLARPDTATDADYEHIQGVIAHEYFHNWTGNRITCRDWFQLSLKEGLTVFRDQEFTADHTSRGVKRIDDVNQLRIRQFAEDAGPLAHPVRPESYIEINNFYTLTVYEKGAEVVRMIQTLVGPDGFRKGCDRYFERHDGQAVTCEDFVRCMEDANGIDLAQFRRWYSQAGTPELHLESQYDPAAQALTLTVRQTCPPTPGQPVKQPFHVPLAIGLLGPDGSDFPVVLDGEEPGAAAATRILSITERQQTFRFHNLPAAPVLSPLRGFSAPLRLHLPRSERELAFLLAHDSDTFNRWDAAQELAARAIIARVHGGAESADAQTLETCLVEALGRVATQDLDDLSYWALLLTLPSAEYVSSLLERVDPEAVHAARQGLRRRLADALAGPLERLYTEHHRIEPPRSDAVSIGRRRIKNVCLGYLMAQETDAAYRLCSAQFDQATNMTDQVAALSLAVNSRHPARDEFLERFYAQWRHEALVVDKWFTIQASCSLPETLTAVEALLRHPDFDLKVPNRVRSLIGTFSQANPVNFHAKDGRGYKFLADHVIALNALNPQIAARLAGALTQWRRYDEQRGALLRAQLQRIAGAEGVSRDVYEVVSKGLA